MFFTQRLVFARIAERRYGNIPCFRKQKVSFVFVFVCVFKGHSPKERSKSTTPLYHYLEKKENGCFTLETPVLYLCTSIIAQFFLPVKTLLPLADEVIGRKSCNYAVPC